MRHVPGSERSPIQPDEDGTASERSSPRQPARTLTVVCRSGLGNRLRVLLSGMALAESTGRRFRMHWPSTTDCSCGFAALFANPWPVVETEPDPVGCTPFQLYVPWARLPDFQNHPAPSLALEYHNWLTQAGVHPGHDAVWLRCQELFHALEPQPAIGALCDAFEARQFRARMIGVHVRRGDFVNERFRPDVASSLSRTLAAVDAALEHDPEAGILLCTDDGAPHPKHHGATRSEGIRETFRERYGARVIAYVPRSLDRSNPVAIEDALVELLLLRRVHALVGTERSSFSELAALGRSIPAVFCNGPSPRLERQERFARCTGLYGLSMFLARRVLTPDVPFHYVWNLWLPGLIQARLPRWPRRGPSSIS